MIKLIERLCIAAIIAILISSIGIKGSGPILQSLFTVIGISFSISVSIIISLDLSRIYNDKVRQNLKNESSKLLQSITIDFIVSSLAFVVGLTFRNETIVIYHWAKLNISLLAIIILIFSLFYELYTFNQMHKFKQNLNEKIIEETKHG